jgi:hypothetical protein
VRCSYCGSRFEVFHDEPRLGSIKVRT